MRGYKTAVCVHVDTQSGCFGGDEADFALQTRVECRAAEAELVLVRLRWRTHEGEVGLSLPMSLEEEKTNEFSVHACRGCRRRKSSDFIHRGWLKWSQLCKRKDEMNVCE